MLKQMFRFRKPLLYSLVCLFVLSSCVDTKKVTYFNNIQDTTFKAIGADVEPLVQKNDLLSITITSLNPEATYIFNAPNVSPVTMSSSLGAPAQMMGYLVSQDGNINFPIIGSIQAAGLTKKQLGDKITQLLVEKKLLVDPIVTMRFLNFRVTVLGEVARPTIVTVNNEKMSILEALGMAGDLTIFAKRDNVLLIREENGQKTMHRVNLNSSDILSSPYYYLKTNDIVYVEPNQTKVGTTSNVRQVLPLILSSLSLVVIILTRYVK